MTDVVWSTAVGGDPKDPTDRRIAFFVLPIFVAVSLFAILQHQMWRDEIEAWNIALRSDSILALFRNREHTGHGMLWYVALYGLSSLTSNPLAMKLLHVAIAATTAAIVLLYFPLPRVHRVLLIFGYFCFFEYSVISRNYAVGLLLVLAFCLVAIRRPGAVLVQASILAVLTQTQAFAVILAIALAAFSAVQIVEARWTGQATASTRQLLIASMLLTGALVIAAWEMKPPATNTFAPGWFVSRDHVRLVQTFSSPWRALVPVPKLQQQFWNTNILDQPGLPGAIGATAMQALLGGFITCWLFLMFMRRPAALMFFLTAFGGMLVFTYTKYIGDTRHYGHFWIATIAGYWLWTASRQRRLLPGSIDRFSRWFELQWQRTLLVTGLIGFAAGCGAVAADIVWGFSPAEQVAGFVRDRYAPDMPIAGDRNYVAASVAMQLNRPFFYPMGDRWGTFCIWDEPGMFFLPAEDVARAIERLRDRLGRDVLVVLSYPAEGPLRDYEAVAVFPSRIVRDERYFLYLARNTLK